MSDTNIELRHQSMDGRFTKLFIIQVPRYGRKLSVYTYLFGIAKKYFPELKENDVDVGIVKNTSFMDGHAVICFNVPNEDVPEDFKNWIWADYFRWDL